MHQQYRGREGRGSATVKGREARDAPREARDREARQPQGASSDRPPGRPTAGQGSEIAEVEINRGHLLDIFFLLSVSMPSFLAS